MPLKRKTTKRVASAKKTLKKIVKKKEGLAAVKKQSPRKTVSGRGLAKSAKKKSVANLIEDAMEEKDLYSLISSRYRGKIKKLVQKCKSEGYVTSNLLLDHIGLEECDDTKNTWECIEKILKKNCIDLVDDSGLLHEAEIEEDSRFFSSDQTSYDSIQMYLRDIGKYKLLSAEEEQDLGKKISARRNLLSKKSRKKLTPTARRKILSDGLEARNKLATANLRRIMLDGVVISDYLIWYKKVLRVFIKRWTNLNLSAALSFQPTRLGGLSNQ